MKIDTYKIGIKNYLDAQVDKNSGLYEFRLIENAIKDINTNKKVLIIVNGKFASPGEEYELFNLMATYEINIFIASDAVAFSDNSDIIESCDYVLHQYADKSLLKLPDNHHYSWVPELFYNNNISPMLMTKQNPVLFYGGGVRDMTMAAKLLDYANIEHKFLLKTVFADERLDYKDYNKAQQESMFTLILSRDKYSKCGWVTSRFVEAINNWSYPIVDCEYDCSEHFVKSGDKVNGYKDAQRVIDKLKGDTFERAAKIGEYSMQLKNTKDNFKKLIMLLIGEQK